MWSPRVTKRHRRNVLQRAIDSGFRRAPKKAQKLYGVTYYSAINAARDGKMAKTNYIFGVASCVLVVAILCIADTVMRNAPTVFLSLSEAEAGQIDMELVARTRRYANNDFSRMMINGSALQEVDGVDKLIKGYSPRFSLASSVTTLERCLDPLQGDLGLEDLGSFNLTMNDSTCYDPTQFYWTDVIYNHTSAEFDHCTFTWGFDYTYHNKSCIETVCGMPFSGSLYLIDFEQEARIDIGTNYEGGIPSKCDVSINKGLADSLGVQENDTIIISVDIRRIAVIAELQDLFDDEEVLNTSRMANIPVRVGSVFDHNGGKVGSETTDVLFADINTFGYWMGRYAHPYLFNNFTELVSNSSAELKNNAQRFVVSFFEREKIYNTLDIQKITSRVSSIASQFVYMTGFDSVSASFLMMKAFINYSNLAMNFDMLLRTAAGVLTFVSIVLIYALMVIGVEKKTFEMGVLRALGMTRKGVIGILTSQAFSYSLPAVVFGVIFAETVVFVVISYLFKPLANKVDPWVTLSSIVVGSVFAMTIPVVASIGPIRVALGHVLSDALDTRKPAGSKMKKLTTVRAKSRLPYPLVALGLVLSIFGFSINYVYPLAMLSGRVFLMTSIFLVILVGFMGGLVLLSMNGQHMLETVLARVMLFWEKNSIRSLVTKNMRSHMRRNRKTTMMFGISVGMVVFLAVATQLVLRQSTQRKLGRRGQKLVLTLSAKADTAYIPEFEKVFEAHSHVIKDWSWRSTETSVLFSTLANPGANADIPQFSVKQKVLALSSNHLEVALSEGFLLAHEPEDIYVGEYADRVMDRLYSYNGSRTLIAGASILRRLGSDLDKIGNRQSPLNVSFVVETSHMAEVVPTANETDLLPGLIRIERSNGMVSLLHRMHLQGLYNSFPGLKVSQYRSAARLKLVEAGASWPTLARLGNYDSVEEIPMQRVMFQLDDEAVGAQVRNFTIDVRRTANRFRSTVRSLKFYDFIDRQDDVGELEALLGQVFTAMMILVMIVCFFSLIASMRANIYEQRKEIAVTRAVGVGVPLLVRIYVEETLIVVTAAQMIGLVVGAAMAYVIGLNYTLLSESQLVFTFPWYLVFPLFVGAVVFSLISSVAPVMNLARKGISEVLRSL